MTPDYQPFFDTISKTRLQKYFPFFEKKVCENIFDSGHGDLDLWISILKELPCIEPDKIDFALPAITVKSDNVSVEIQQKIENLFRAFKLWRKGPYDIHGVYVDSEWRSDMKWERIRGHISSLEDKLVLDVGCGNGYHLWKMAEHNPQIVLGIDPTLLYVMQFFAIQHFIKNSSVGIFPFGVEQMPENIQLFDTVFCMGVFYHARSPFDLLYKLKDLMAMKGELILETLVVEGNEGYVLVPQKRYAQMTNVWFIPSVLTLEHWLARVGFKEIRCVDVNHTTSDEQRATDWIGNVETAKSFIDFLDPSDNTKTVEGYPAPMRAVFVAHKT